MNIIDLLNESHIYPKRTALTKGGEYHSACPDPQCAGSDRFCIWPKEGKGGRYWCRQCLRSGDSIQFCRDFLGMSYRAACAKVQLEPIRTYSFRKVRKTEFSPAIAIEPSEVWQKKANDFVSDCHQNLLVNEEAMSHLQKRGFTAITVKEFLLGWNPTNQFIKLSEWALPEACNETGREKKLWLPGGIVIPTANLNKIIKIKIRRHSWKEGDDLPKYVEVSGSMKCPSIYGNHGMKTIVLVESELDAMLIQQVASDLCCCMAIGGVGKKPDFDSDRLLRCASTLIFALDFDEAGKKAYKFWKSTYSNLRAWPVPKGKSPGDAFIQGVDLREWILDAIPKKYKGETKQ